MKEVNWKAEPELLQKHPQAYLQACCFPLDELNNSFHLLMDKINRYNQYHRESDF